jgi:hypothetical protein
MAIGGNHLVHAMRRNIGMLAVVVNNNVYGLTGGQSSPTTPLGALHPPPRALPSWRESRGVGCGGRVRDYARPPSTTPRAGSLREALAVDGCTGGSAEQLPPSAGMNGAPSRRHDAAMDSPPSAPHPCSSGSRPAYVSRQEPPRQPLPAGAGRRAPPGVLWAHPFSRPEPPPAAPWAGEPADECDRPASSTSACTSPTARRAVCATFCRSRCWCPTPGIPGPGLDAASAASSEWHC